ncbi:MAG TPA: response regulator [Opitutaceae bacterium]|nr:response regulator [Opitutaceae bacterium]
MNPLVASPAVGHDSRPFEILLIEDEPGDVRLTVEALRSTRVRNRIHAVEDGVEALDFLRRRPPFAGAPRPDLILLDLNLPRKDGRQVLAEIKSDAALRTIPVVVLSTSRARDDVLRSYDLHANCFISKPMDFNEFNAVVKSIEDFWLTVARLPSPIA